MATKDRLKKGLSEIRTVVLGAQILLGFQYQAIFQSRFETLPAWSKDLELAAFGLLIACIALLIAPTSFHRLSERGEATVRQSRFVSLMIVLALGPFAAALGANLAVALGGEIDAWAAGGVGVAATAITLFLWFGIETMQRRATSPPEGADEPLPLEEKIGELLTEARIVLPGVQALLGFQFAAYLTDAFAKLPASMKLAHTASLLLLLVAMVLLMTPAPYHRLAEHGEDTPRVERVAARCVLWALPPLALALALDFYIAVRLVVGLSVSLAAGIVAAMASLTLWFVVPLLARARGKPAARGGTSREALDAPS